MNQHPVEAKIIDLSPEQILQKWEENREAVRAAGLPVKPWQECFDEFKETFHEVLQDLKEMVENLDQSRKELDHEAEEKNDKDAENEESIADSDRSHYGLSESDELFDFGTPTEEKELAQCPSVSQTAVHTINLGALSHQTYLLKSEICKHTNNVRSIHDLATTTLCMMQACADARTLCTAGEDKHWLVFSISHDIEEAQATLETLSPTVLGIVCSNVIEF